MKAGSPDPVMTRQRCAAVGAATRPTAAGVPAVRTVARAAQPAAAATAASRRVEQRLRRIGCPFSPGQRANAAESNLPETFPEPFTTIFLWKSSSTLGFSSPNLREFPKHASIRCMAQVARRTTIRHIADQAGVSIATVSRVLNGREDVSDETRDLVRR